MGTFTTKLRLGGHAFGVSGGIKEEGRQRAEDLRTLDRLKKRYEAESGVVDA